MKHNLIILTALLGMGLVSCDLGNDPDIDGTATQEVAGEYFTQLYSAPGGDLYLDYSLMTISNTAANVADRVRITDDGHVWGYNIEGVTNVTNKTFSADKAPNAWFDAAPDASAFDPVGTMVTAESDYPKYMTITDGVILTNAANVPSAAPADSIAFFATGWYYIDNYRVIGHVDDTVSTDPLEIVQRNIYEYVDETLDLEDGPYFLTGYQRTGFLEDEH